MIKEDFAIFLQSTKHLNINYLKLRSNFDEEDIGKLDIEKLTMISSTIGIDMIRLFNLEKLVSLTLINSYTHIKYENSSLAFAFLQKIMKMSNLRNLHISLNNVKIKDLK